MTELTAGRPALPLEIGTDVTTRQRNLVFAVTALGAFMGSLDLSIVNVAFPSLERSFPADSTAALAWVITAYAIVYAALLVTAGRTADRLGRRRVFFAGLAVFTVASALCGMAPSVPLLVAGRVAQAAGAALLLPASLGLLLTVFPASARSQAVALWGGVGALAVATGPSLGAAVINAGGWRWAFYMNVPIGLAAWLAGRGVLPDDRPDRAPAPPDYVGVGMLTVALSSLVLAISEGPSWGWTDPRVLGGVAAFAILGAAFLRRCARSPEPVLDLTLFAHRSFAVANAATLVYAMGFFALLLGNILFLTGVWHYSILRAGLAVTPGPLVVAAVIYWPVSGLLSTELCALYLLVANWFDVNVNELFAGQSIEDAKSFLRMHIGADGTLTIHPIGIDKICKKWAPDPDAEPHSSWLRPDAPLTAHRIEPPIRVR